MPIGRYEISISVNGKTFTEFLKHIKDHILLVYNKKLTNDLQMLNILKTDYVMKYYFSLFLIISLVLGFSSCTDTYDIHPIYPETFKVLESTEFVLVSDSINDTIKYKTEDFKYVYDKSGEIFRAEYQTINLYCTIEGDLDRLNLLKMQLYDDNSLEIELHFKISNAYLKCLNNTICFTDNFINDFELNGIVYKGCWFYNHTDSNGELMNLLIYSQTFGVLRVVNLGDGTIYNRCFNCD